VSPFGLQKEKGIAEEGHASHIKENRNMGFEVSD